MTFTEKLWAIQRAKQSCVCVGLDPDLTRLPDALRALPAAEAVLAFNRAIIEATHDLACAYKPNMAFYEALGAEGWAALEATCAMIPDDCLIIADAKRGDIGNTARHYATALFDQLGADACTISAYMGRDTVVPFLQDARKAAFVLVLTSNPGAADFQHLSCDGQSVYQHVTQAVSALDEEHAGTVGFVVGATRPEELAALRTAFPTTPFLIPGVGAQGGDPQAVMQASATETGPVLINSSRQILYASAGDDFADAARAATQALRNQLH